MQRAGPSEREKNRGNHESVRTCRFAVLAHALASIQHHTALRHPSRAYVVPHSRLARRQFRRRASANQKASDWQLTDDGHSVTITNVQKGVAELRRRSTRNITHAFTYITHTRQCKLDSALDRLHGSSASVTVMRPASNPLLRSMSFGYKILYCWCA